MMDPCAFVLRSVEARLALVRASDDEVAFLVVELSAVKFCNVEEPVVRKFETVARPLMKVLPRVANVEKRLVDDAVVAK